MLEDIYQAGEVKVVYSYSMDAGRQLVEEILGYFLEDDTTLLNAKEIDEAGFIAPLEHDLQDMIDYDYAEGLKP